MHFATAAVRQGPFLLCAIVALAGAPPAAAEPEAPLGHQGRWLTDARGRVVTLHGFNLVAKSPPYDPSIYGFGADDAQMLAVEGFNTMRLGLIYNAVEPQRGIYDPGYLDRMADLEQVLAHEGIFTLLDMHQDLWSERYGGEGLPEWATFDDGLPRQPSAGSFFSYATIPALQRAFDNFWANHLGIQTAYADGWRRVADRFRTRKRVIGYDIFNSPWPGSQWPSCANALGCPVFDRNVLTAFTKRVLGRIRQADSRSLVFYEPHAAFDYGSETHHDDTGDERAGFSFHSHCLAVAPQGTSSPESFFSCPVNHDQVFENASIHSDTTGDALLLTDFGAMDDLVELERLAVAADRFMLSWQNWTYADILPSGGGYRLNESIIRDPTKPPTPDNLKQASLDILVRPYPQAVAGTPERWSFDSAKTFELSYLVERPDGSPVAPDLETEVFMPRRHYPGGYDAKVEGATVVSEQDARILRLVAKPGAREVSVRATPARRSPPAGEASDCLDRSEPSSRISRRALRATRRGLRMRGSARDRSCHSTAATARVARVEVSVGRRVGRRCRHLVSPRRFGRVRNCSRRTWLRARGGSRWRFSSRAGLPAGRYRLASRARDVEGNLERRATRRNRARVRVR
jgi:endoglycosylceramidase